MYSAATVFTTSVSNNQINKTIEELAQCLSIFECMKYSSLIYKNHQICDKAPTTVAAFDNIAALNVTTLSLVM